MIMRVFFLDFQGTMRRADIKLTAEGRSWEAAGREVLKNWRNLGFACLEQTAFFPWANFAGSVLMSEEAAADVYDPTQGAEPLK